ncbi:MAG: methylmalonate-semialdehyde dehydrogenase (CoA acylating), partial [Polaromonas sp.]
MNTTPPLASRSVLPLIGHWTAGRLSTATSSRNQDVFNPATGQVTGRVALASAAEVDAAVAA